MAVPRTASPHDECFHIAADIVVGGRTRRLMLCYGLLAGAQNPLSDSITCGIE
jgi:hypothetical protein